MKKIYPIFYILGIFIFSVCKAYTDDSTEITNNKDFCEKIAKRYNEANLPVYKLDCEKVDKQTIQYAFGSCLRESPFPGTDLINAVCLKEVQKKLVDGQYGMKNIYLSAWRNIPIDERRSLRDKCIDSMDDTVDEAKKYSPNFIPKKYVKCLVDHAPNSRSKAYFETLAKQVDAMGINLDYLTRSTAAYCWGNAPEKATATQKKAFERVSKQIVNASPECSDLKADYARTHKNADLSNASEKDKSKARAGLLLAGFEHLQDMFKVAMEEKHCADSSSASGSRCPSLSVEYRKDYAKDVADAFREGKSCKDKLSVILNDSDQKRKLKGEHFLKKMCHSENKDLVSMLSGVDGVVKELKAENFNALLRAKAVKSTIQTYYSIAAKFPRDRDLEKCSKYANIGNLDKVKKGIAQTQVDFKKAAKNPFYLFGLQNAAKDLMEIRNEVKKEFFKVKVLDEKNKNAIGQTKSRDNPKVQKSNHEDSWAAYLKDNKKANELVEKYNKILSAYPQIRFSLPSVLEADIARPETWKEHVFDAVKAFASTDVGNFYELKDKAEMDGAFLSPTIVADTYSKVKNAYHDNIEAHESTYLANVQMALENLCSEESISDQELITVYPNFADELAEMEPAYKDYLTCEKKEIEGKEVDETIATTLASAGCWIAAGVYATPTLGASAIPCAFYDSYLAAKSYETESRKERWFKASASVKGSSGENLADFLDASESARMFLYATPALVAVDPVMQFYNDVKAVRQLGKLTKELEKEAMGAVKGLAKAKSIEEASRSFNQLAAVQKELNSKMLAEIDRNPSAYEKFYPQRYAAVTDDLAKRGIKGKNSLKKALAEDFSERIANKEVFLETLKNPEEFEKALKDHEKFFKNLEEHFGENFVLSEEDKAKLLTIERRGHMSEEEVENMIKEIQIICESGSKSGFNFDGNKTSNYACSMTPSHKNSLVLH